MRYKSSFFSPLLEYNTPDYTNGLTHHIKLSDHISVLALYTHNRFTFTLQPTEDKPSHLSHLIMPTQNLQNIKGLIDTLSQVKSSADIPVTTHCPLPPKIAALNQHDSFEKCANTVQTELAKLGAVAKQKPQPVSITENDLFKRARELYRDGAKHVCMLNPMNGFKLGGGAFIGASNLEETIFGICKGYAYSLLEHTLVARRLVGAAQSVSGRPEYYPNYESDAGAFYTPNVTVIKSLVSAQGGAWLDHSYKKLEPNEQFQLDIVGNSSAHLSDSYQTAAHQDLIMMKLRAQLFAVAKHGTCSHLLLTDFGCSGFHNDPRLNAKYYAQAIREGDYQTLFAIEFTIKSHHNKSIFSDAFNKEMQRLSKPPAIEPPTRDFYSP